MPAKRMTEIDPLDRPREKIERKGACALTDSELIAAILGKGTKNNDVLTISKRVAKLLEKNNLPSYDTLLQIEGIGPSKASVLMACFELANRYGTPAEREQIRITEPEHILRIKEVSDLAFRSQEHFLVTTLNGASEVINTRTVTMGLLNHSLVHPREVFADAITDRAAAIICIHNHPSGNPDPSSEDIAVTRQLADAGTILGISLLDHLIITKGAVTSLRSLGYL
ncbi:MAG TPA: DNA repair protein RadC [Methanospirillum sp.]|uniref:RadC family protein n=1 Tax=Methanospirillum sp. TaxID=45200 RepID=UPI002BF19087|nr:DNA repair protein RadC [Methanospirillum sp.]HOJ95347.1 DNA repair protein RadC [Methanospirillum sp.]HOL41497.1 DNA repair protein RadC [Methanospirillum sp.]HPP76741.1 DNA repair protein RadC [Methanospirillum sp.]